MIDPAVDAMLCVVEDRDFRMRFAEAALKMCLTIDCGTLPKTTIELMDWAIATSRGVGGAPQ